MVCRFGPCFSLLTCTFKGSSFLILSFGSFFNATGKGDDAEEDAEEIIGSNGGIFGIFTRTCSSTIFECLSLVSAVTTMVWVGGGGSSRGGGVEICWR